MRSRIKYTNNLLHNNNNNNNNNNNYIVDDFYEEINDINDNNDVKDNNVITDINIITENNEIKDIINDIFNSNETKNISIYNYFLFIILYYMWILLI